MAPLISILTPCYGSHHTLAMALASLVAQSLDDWECIIVDDGSQRPIAPIVDAFDEPRFRLLEEPTNRGRGRARQIALEASRGQFVGMLDADDWYYGRKLERQVQILEEHPELAAITSSMAVFDEEGHLVGRRDCAPGPLTITEGSLESPPAISFPPILIRGHVARQHSFDPHLRRAEDPDYLRRLLAGRTYGITTEIHYAYRESWSPQAVREAQLAFYYQRYTARRDLVAAPIAMSRMWLKSALRSTTYALLDALGHSAWLFERRNQPTHEADREHFHRQRTRVQRHLPRSLRRAKLD